MKILVGYDGSESARRALDLSIDYAKAFKADVLIVTSLVGGTVTDGDKTHYAEESVIDRIIINVKRYSKTSKLLFGSNAQ